MGFRKSCLPAVAPAVPTAVAVRPSAQAAENPGLPLTVTNNSGRSEAVRLHVLGESGSKLGYVTADGAFTPWTGGATPSVAAPDVSIPGRVDMSFGDRIEFKLSGSGLVQPPVGRGRDADRDVLLDWSEFTYDEAGLWLNSPRVSVTGTDGRTLSTGALAPDGRDKVIGGLKAGKGFADLVQTRADGTVLRACRTSTRRGRRTPVRT